MASYYSVPRKSTVSTKSGKPILTNAIYQPSPASQNMISTISYRKSVIGKRNGLDDDPEDSGRKNFALQTCKDTGVGDCPACLGTRTNCHQNECQLCCEVKVCGPSFKNCPFNPEAETQTCEFLNMACKCVDPCGGETCVISDRCGATGLDCRCLDRSCNTSRHCIIVDNEDACSFTDVECKCIDKGCAYNKSCIVIDEEEYCEGAFDEYNDPIDPSGSTYGTDYGVSTNPSTALSHSGQLYDPTEIIRRCHHLCHGNPPNYTGQCGSRVARSVSPKYKILTKKRLPIKPCGDYNAKRERKRSPSSDFSSGNETDHFSIILEDEEKALRMPSSSKNQTQRTDAGVRALSTSSVSRQAGNSSTRSANIKCSHSGVSVDNDRCRAQPRSRSQSKSNQKPLRLVCIQEGQRRSPYCPNPASCKICRPN